MFEQEDEWVSKTQMKKQMNDLQDLGMALTKLSNDTPINCACRLSAPLDVIFL